MKDVSKYFYYIDGSKYRKNRIERIRQVVNFEDVSKPYDRRIPLPRIIIINSKRPKWWLDILEKASKKTA